MPPASAAVEIPKRALFKASEVCDLVKVQPYVLRSWEAEFPELGVTKAGGGVDPNMRAIDSGVWTCACFQPRLLRSVRSK